MSLSGTGAADSAVWPGTLEKLLQSQPDRFGVVMQNPDRHRVQIIYTQIDRDLSGRPVFTSHSYRLNTDEYFYPASTVKLPTALIALEKLGELEEYDLERDTPMLTLAERDSQTVALADETAPGGLPTIGHYIRKILLVSDNDAFNRLYEFIGQEALNEAMHEKGFSATRIIHRLELARTVEENRHTNPVRFVEGAMTAYEQAGRYSSKHFLANEAIPLGVAEIVDGERVAGAKDFAEKNAFPLQDQHDVIRALIFPESVDEVQRFAISQEDYRFIYRNMSAYPGDSGISAYADMAEYPEGYVKFLMFGGDAAEIPDNIRIFNKVGDAYGFLTDAAYIIDVKNNVEFILAATVYTNQNETFNDNEYEYDETGFPFLRHLGQAIYEVELARKRDWTIDFDWLGQ